MGTGWNNGKWCQMQAERTDGGTCSFSGLFEPKPFLYMILITSYSV